MPKFNLWLLKTLILNFAYIHSRRKKLGIFILFQKCQLVYPNKVNPPPIRQYEYESHFHVILRSYISSNRFGGVVHVCFHWRWQLRFDRTWLCVCDAWKKNCAKTYSERKVLLKIFTNSLSKKIHFKFKVYKKDRSQMRSTHAVCF